MSQLLQVATRGGGAVNVSLGTLVPDYFDQGIPYDSNGGVAVANLGAIHHYHQGLPFTAVGRISVAQNGTVARVGNGGAPFNSANFLVEGGGVVNHYSAGIPYTATQQIKTI